MYVSKIRSGSPNLRLGASQSQPLLPRQRLHTNICSLLWKLHQLPSTTIHRVTKPHLDRHHPSHPRPSLREDSWRASLQSPGCFPSSTDYEISDRQTRNTDNMAQDSDKPTSADKGKGKAVEDPKQEKSLANGKKDDEKIIDCT